MSDLISRQAVIRYLCTHCPDDAECFADCDDIKSIKDLPSVTPAERTGHWTHPKVVYMPYEYADSCSCCKEWGKILTFKANYCPNCGADMREIKND